VVFAQKKEEKMAGIELTVAYDNYGSREGLQAAHGFACVIRSGDSTVLFDTGGSGQILLENMAELRIDPAEIEAVVFSHMHWDHIGGLDAVLAANSDVAVYAPAAFSSSFLRDVETRAGALVKTKQVQQVTRYVWTTDVLEGLLAEQALCVETAEGVVVITGCAHPGVVKLARSAQGTSGGEVYAVLGGFHMAGMSPTEVGRVVDGLQDLSVQRVGPCHCSGDAARQAMRQAFGEGYIEMGLGAHVSFPAAGDE
jgi:7,8-dihydropterin-6-yl-methyl-4-(beta-D-ribofuranosyl)aminobenzene 5'-phosphate synthase